MSVIEISLKFYSIFESWRPWPLSYKAILRLSYWTLGNLYSRSFLVSFSTTPTRSRTTTKPSLRPLSSARGQKYSLYLLIRYLKSLCSRRTTDENVDGLFLHTIAALFITSRLARPSKIRSHRCYELPWIHVTIETIAMTRSVII